jgi:hypothetical protein
MPPGLELPIRFLRGIPLTRQIRGRVPDGLTSWTVSAEEQKQKRARYDETYASILDGMTR